MPSLRTAFTFLTTLGVVVLILQPIALFIYLFKNWDLWKDFYRPGQDLKIWSLIAVLLNYYATMCGVVILHKLDDHLHNHPEGTGST